jgi:type VI protein secretion system component Hcp
MNFRSSFLALTLILVLAVPVLAASTLCMMVPGARGTVSDKEHRDAIELISMKGPNKGSESGPIVVRKYQDDSSTTLMAAATAGNSYPSIVIDLSSPFGSGQMVVVQKFTLGKAVIKEANVVYEKLSEGARPVEEITIGYETINWETIPCRGDGSPSGSSIKDSWNNGTRSKT